MNNKQRREWLRDKCEQIIDHDRRGENMKPSEEEFNAILNESFGQPSSDQLMRAGAVRYNQGSTRYDDKD